MRIFALAVLATAICGCTTDTRGTQLVAVDTPGVAGATCTLTSPSIGSRTVVTPATVALRKGRENVAVHCSKECYYEGVGVIVASTPGAADSNVVTRGELSPDADAAGGAMNSYASEIQVAMIPISGCRPGASPPRR